MSRTVNPLIPPNSTTLHAALAPNARRLLDAAVDAATEAGVTLWAVGGPIRDTALARHIEDIDLAVVVGAATIASVIAARLDAQLTLEPRFGTASVTLEGDRLDLASLRSERYATPGALPDVTLGVTIEQDLARRDFSVNAIALALSGPHAGHSAGNLLDPHHGLSHLAAGRFAILHDRSFEDDATRLWRAARLAAQRDLRPHPHPRALIEDGTRWLAPISGNRLWSELALIAQRGRAARTLALLDEWGTLRGTHPAFAFSEQSRRALRHRGRPLPAAILTATLLAPLPPADAAAIIERLDAPTAAREATAGARTLLAAPADTAPTTLERLATTTTEARTAARWLGDETQTQLQRHLRRWERTRPHLNASDLLHLGIPEGPELGEWLRALRRARYLGTLRSPGQARALINNTQRATRRQP